MKKWRKAVSSLLVLAMLVSVFPLPALAAEETDMFAQPNEEVAAPADSPDVQSGQLEVPPPAKAGEETSGEEEETLKETKKDVFSEETEISEMADEVPEKITFNVNGELVEANLVEPETVPYTLRPVKEYKYNLQMGDIWPGELKGIKIADINNSLKDDFYGSTSNKVEPAVEPIWWSYGSYSNWTANDDFQRYDSSKGIDLSSDDVYSSYYNYNNDSYLHLIVGGKDQFDENSKRYLIYVELPGIQNYLDYTVRTMEDQELEIDSKYYYNEYRHNGKVECWITVKRTAWAEDNAKLGIQLSADRIKKGETLAVYEGYHETVAEAEAAKRVMQDGSLVTVDVSKYDNMPEFTLVVRGRDGEILQVRPLRFEIYETSKGISGVELYKIENNKYISAGYDSSWVTDENNNRIYTVRLDKGNSINEKYCLQIRYYDNNTTGTDKLSAVFEGLFKTQNDAENAGKVSIISKLYGGNSPEMFSFKDKREYTAIDPEGDVYQFAVVVEETPANEETMEKPTPLSQDTYFRIEGINKEENGGAYQSRIMPYVHDSYYYNGYQAVFVLDGEGNPVAEKTEIYPTFYTGSKVSVYAGSHSEKGDQIAGEKQTSGKSKQIFKNGESIPYSAGAENGVNLKNYWVTFLTQTEKAKLFINGVTNADPSHRDKDGNPVREIILDSTRNYQHDIFVANLGAEAMNDLKVTLRDAEYIQLDEYWTVDGTKGLNPFTTVTQEESTMAGVLDNVAKVRLLPVRDANGEIKNGVIKGTLEITGGGETYTIKLTGRSGAFAITTDTLLEGVKYVPYSSVIQTNNMYSDNTVTFTLKAGSVLPQGVELKPNGELYGVPKVWSRNPWTITVAASSEDDEGTHKSEKTFQLTIKENTNENVWNASDLGEDADYSISQAIINQDGTVSKFNTTLTDAELAKDNSWAGEVQRLVSRGDYQYFLDNVYLDGEKLTSGYTSEPGSTVITLSNQTLQKNGDGTHTIAAEFRQGDRNNGILRRSAQNYTISGIGSSGSGSGSSSGGSSKPSIRPGSAATGSPSVPRNPAARVPMADVDTNGWYYEDVAWAYEQGLMTGVSSTSFAPNAPFSNASILMVLARLAKVDLDTFTTNPYEEIILSGTWYTPAAVWAVQAGMIPSDVQFHGDDSLPRSDMSVILVKYIKSLGLDTSIPPVKIEFADAALMSQEVNDAFQVLYNYGVFRGVGNNYMDPAGYITRAQFSALLHRLSAKIS